MAEGSEPADRAGDSSMKFLGHQMEWKNSQCFPISWLGSNYSKWGQDWDRSRNQDHKGLSSHLYELRTEHPMELRAERETKEEREPFETACPMLLKVKEPNKSQAPDNSVGIMIKILPLSLLKLQHQWRVDRINAIC